MARIIIKKTITTEKSFAKQDEGVWTFQVANDANKHEIKLAIENLFDVSVDTVNTTRLRPKIRKLRGHRIHTRRHSAKVARIRLKKDSKKLDLTKLNR